jgi:hypothetical protein
MLCPECQEIYDGCELEYTLLRFCIIPECSGRMIERYFRKWITKSKMELNFPCNCD